MVIFKDMQNGLLAVVNKPWEEWRSISFDKFTIADSVTQRALHLRALLRKDRSPLGSEPLNAALPQSAVFRFCDRSE
jgi:hypothetical protein